MRRKFEMNVTNKKLNNYMLDGSQCQQSSSENKWNVHTTTFKNTSFFTTYIKNMRPYIPQYTSEAVTS